MMVPVMVAVAQSVIGFQIIIMFLTSLLKQGVAVRAMLSLIQCLVLLIGCPLFLASLFMAGWYIHGMVVFFNPCVVCYLCHCVVS